MEIQLQPNEQIIKKGIANNLHGLIINIGSMILTNKRIYFATKPLNFQQYDLSLPLNDIQDVIIKNHFYIFPYGITIMCNDQTEQQFAVWKRHAWKNAILKQKQVINT